MLETALAASAHHILAFLLVAILAVELALVRPGMTVTDRRIIGRIDALYGLTALTLLILGLWRVYALEKGLDFYLTSVWFWVKIAAYILVGVFSVPPTLRFLAWGRMGDSLPDPTDIARVRTWMRAEAALLLVIPVAAAMMARGMG
jgi:putative membrane protein